MADTIVTIIEDVDSRFAWDRKTLVTDLEGNFLERDIIFDDGREKRVVFLNPVLAQVEWTDPEDVALWNTRSVTRRVDADTGALGRLIFSEKTRDDGLITRSTYQVVDGENVLWRTWRTETDYANPGFFFSTTDIQFSTLPGFQRIENEYRTPDGGRESVRTVTPSGTAIMAEDHWEDRAPWQDRMEYTDAAGNTLSVAKNLDLGGTQHESYVDGVKRASYQWVEDSRVLRVYNADGELFRKVKFDSDGGVIQSGTRGPREDYEELPTTPLSGRSRNFVEDYEWTYTYDPDGIFRSAYFEGGVRTTQVTEDWSLGGAGKPWAIIVSTFDGAGDLIARNTIFDSGKQRLTTYEDGQRVSQVLTGASFDPVKQVSFQETQFDESGAISRTSLNDWGILRLETLEVGAPIEAVSYSLEPRLGPTTWIEIESAYGTDGRVTRKEVDYGNGFSRLTTIDDDRWVSLTVDEDPDGTGGEVAWETYLFVGADDFRFNFIDYDDGDKVAWLRDDDGFTEIAFDGDGDEDWLYQVLTLQDGGPRSVETYDRTEDVPSEQLALLSVDYPDQIA